MLYILERDQQGVKENDQGMCLNQDEVLEKT